ncbi:unnamed protein product [Rotaria sordida]|uniref:3-hydroxyisobutyryl-CoA hydrolase, mitochondrial n=1 Tax=Rotaria sordida TaxID=392033 RepID=A0A819T2R0_9BILA|nr:unnamed protein product [Rotaria sordida]
MFRSISQLCFLKSYPKLNIYSLLSIGKVSDKKTADTSNDVIFKYINEVGIIQLNKPEMLNVITFEINRRISSKEWEKDGKTKLVIIKNTGSKAFSVGGNIKILVQLVKTQNENILFQGLREMYELNYFIGTYKLPYIAFINGLTMGGGCGLSIHGPFRVATEKTIVAMPETAIGLFPDVGASHFLSRLPNNLGVFLGLTGHRLHGIDTVHAGLATHFIPTNRLEEVEQKLVDISNANYDSVKEILDKYCETVKSQSSFSLQEYLPLINQIFSIDTKNVETIFEELKSNGSQFASKQLSILQKMSPTSLKITLEQLKRGKKFDLKECVRAMVIDKDNKPQWQPSQLEDISNEEIASYFSKLSSDKELQL